MRPCALHAFFGGSSAGHFAPSEICLAPPILFSDSSPLLHIDDMPDVADSYLHRVGRAGRFGTKGLAITFASTDEDAKILEEVQSRFEVSITQLPETIDVSSYMTA